MLEVAKISNYGLFGAKGDFSLLVKLRLSLFSVITGIIGLIVGAGNSLSLSLLLNTTVGLVLTSFGTAIFNQILEVDADAKMKRTADRPLPTGRITHAVAFLSAWVLTGLGISHLMAKVNMLSALVVLATIVIYLFIYTPLKKYSSWNTVVGAIAGALPPLAGWAGGFSYNISRSDYIEWVYWLVKPQALFLFAVLFFWQLYHFLALCWMYRDDYANGGFIMITNKDSTGSKTSLWAFISALSLLVISYLPFMYKTTGNNIFVVSMFIVNILSTVGILYLALKFYKNRDRNNARNLFFSSLFYLPIAMTLVFILKS